MPGKLQRSEFLSIVPILVRPACCCLIHLRLFALGKAQTEVGVQLVKSRAVIESEHTVRLLVDGRPVRARHILIATGAKPQLGLFASLGSKVAIVCRGDNLLQAFDEDVREAVRTAYERRGIQLVFNDTLMRIERASAMGSLTAATLGGLSLEADQVLLAIGRKPNSSGLGLEAIGVERKSNGAIVVDDHARTNVPGIHAIGDVTDRVNLTPVALREGHAFADRLFGNEPWAVDYDLIPKAVFSSPEVGTVGMTGRHARSAFDRVAIYRTRFRALKGYGNRKAATYSDEGHRRSDLRSHSGRAPFRGTGERAHSVDRGCRARP